MTKLDSKLDKLNDKLQSIDKTLIKNTADLELHMLRTEQNEKMIQVIYDDMKPVKKHVNHVEGGLKLLGILSLVIGVAVGTLRLFGIL